MKKYLIEEKERINTLNLLIELKTNQLKELKSNLNKFSNQEEVKKIINVYQSLKRDLAELNIDLRLKNNEIDKISITIDLLNNLLENSKSFLDKVIKFENKKEEEERLNELIISNRKKIDQLTNGKIILQDKITEKNIKLKESEAIKKRSEAFNLQTCNLSILNIQNELKVLNKDVNYYRFIYEKIRYIEEKEIKELNRIIEKQNGLNNYKAKLSYSNGYERKQIHEELELNYGDGNINKLLNENKKKYIQLKKYIDRSIDKIRNESKKDFEKNKLKSNCKKVLIDGNNLTYDANNEKIGLTAVLYLVNHLYRNLNIDVILVFDSNFNNEIQTLKNEIPENIKITSADQSQKADDILINLGNNHLNTFIISNDNFIDYGRNEIIENNRLIKHRIENGIIQIPLLDIAIEYK